MPVCQVEVASEEESEADVAQAGAPKARAPRREQAKADRPGARAAVTDEHRARFDRRSIARSVFYDVYLSVFAFLLKCLQREVYRCFRTGRKTAVASDTFLMALEGVSEGV